MDLALLLSALALGLAGVPHCAAMCAAPCAALTGVNGASSWAFHGTRTVSYAAAGAAAAGSVGALAALAQWTPMLKPVWTLLHAAVFVLGLWMLWQGRQPVWLESLGRGSRRAGGWQVVRGPARAGLAGSLWVAWPCGLLQSALLLAALANEPAGGALVMAGFAAVTAAGLMLGPGLWAWLGGGAVAARAQVWGVRLAGGMLAAASGWALTHGVWARVAAYCFG
jgi:uncharacterized protein